MQPLVDVLTVNYLTPELVSETAMVLSRDPALRILAWDNSGDLPPNLPAEVHADSGGRNVFFSRGNNQLFAQSQAPYVLLLNPDVTIAPGEIHELVRRLETAHDAWGVAPLLVRSNGESDPYLHRLPTTRALLADRLPLLRPFPPFRFAYRRYRYRDVPDVLELATVEQPAAACLLLRRSMIGHRLFDERLRLFFSDTELALRLNGAGRYCRYAPDIRITHGRSVSLRRANTRHPYSMAAEYDRSITRYARIAELHGRWMLEAVCGLRRVAASLLGRTKRRRAG